MEQSRFKKFNCNKAEVACAIAVFPILEIGSLESAKIVAEFSKEYCEVEYFLASPLTCDVKGYKDSESIYVDRYHVLPHGDCVDFDPNFLDKIYDKKFNHFVTVYSCMFQCIMLACYTSSQVFKKIIKSY